MWKYGRKRKEGGQMEEEECIIFANQITLLCMNKTLNPFGISKLLNTVT